MQTKSNRTGNFDLHLLQQLNIQKLYFYFFVCASVISGPEIQSMPHFPRGKILINGSGEISFGDLRIADDESDTIEGM